jgi:hypothetical protein
MKIKLDKKKIKTKWNKIHRIEIEKQIKLKKPLKAK